MQADRRRQRRVSSRAAGPEISGRRCELFNRLDSKVLPTSEKASAAIFAGAAAQADERPAQSRYGNTIFHLEPNVKDAPGGLRDYQAAAWLRQIAENKQSLNITAAEEDLASGAVDFLSAIRCFLHYANGRNDNTLTYELQACGRGAVAGRFRSRTAECSGVDATVFSSCAHAQSLAACVIWSKRRWYRRRFGSDFSTSRAGSKTEPTNGRPFGVRDGMYEVFNQPALSDRSQIFSLFTDAARAGIPLSRHG